MKNIIKIYLDIIINKIEIGRINISYKSKILNIGKEILLKACP